jgi:acetyl-CoA carboxylase beta subunit
LQRSHELGGEVSWLQKLLPPKIKRSPGAAKKAVPEGLWIKCEVCEAVLYRADLEKSVSVCPKCAYHNRITARERLDVTLDPEGRYEIGSEVVPVDFLKFVDTAVTASGWRQTLRKAEKATRWWSCRVPLRPSRWWWPPSNFASWEAPWAQ